MDVCVSKFISPQNEQKMVIKLEQERKEQKKRRRRKRWIVEFEVLKKREKETSWYGYDFIVET